MLRSKERHSRHKVIGSKSSECAGNGWSEFAGSPYLKTSDVCYYPAWDDHSDDRQDMGIRA